jgi:hypothetical protein
MNPVRWKYTAAVMLVLSVILLGTVLVLPVIKSPQHAVYYGPSVSFNGGGTSISGYYIPTVDAGSRVTVSMYDFIPGAVDISIFPSLEGGVTPAGGPIYVKTPTINTTEYFASSATQPYGIYVISRNQSRFTLIIDATYSPWFWLPAYNAVCLFLTFGSAVLLYYYTFTAKRWKNEQKAIREARGGSDEDEGAER